MALKKLVSDLTQGLTAYPNHNTPSDSGGFNYGGSTSVFDTKLFQQRNLSYKKPLSRQDNPEPLIPQLLPGVDQEPSNSILYLDDAQDGFIRGGVINAIKRAAYDNIRMNRFFDTGEGIIFIGMQQSLQLTNPIIQEGGGDLANTFEDFLNLGIGLNSSISNTNRVFNHTNLVKQISEGGYTGVYYNRAGANPTIQSEDQNKYEAVHKPGRKFDANRMGEFNKTSGLESGNRLITLGKKLSVGHNSIVGNSFELSSPQSLMQNAVGFDIGDLRETWNDIKRSFNEFINNPLETLSENTGDNVGFNPGENILYQYSGGPGSTYGIGDTILYRYQRTSGEYDHQGHPLSYQSYFDPKNALTTVIGGSTFLNKDGEFSPMSFLTDTVNENLFGGNNILGSDSIFLNDSGKLTGGSILEGLANQIFGEDTVSFVTDLFDGNGFGSPDGDYDDGTSGQGSYLIGKTQSISGVTKKDKILKASIDGSPKPGFIATPFKSLKGKGKGSTLYKPDGVVDQLRTQIEDIENFPEGVGKVVNFNPKNPYDYKPGALKMSEDGRKRLGEEIETFTVGEDYKGNHYYSKTQAKKVQNDTGRNYTREQRIGLGNPGELFDDKLLNNYTSVVYKDKRIDKINALDIHRVKNNTFTDAAYRDLIRFRFEAIDTENPSQQDVMVFRAFLDNYGDNFNSEWKDFKYNGRGEPFYVYQGFKRSVNFSFKIAAQSRFEMMPLYRKLNFLCTTTAPDYSDDGRIRGNFIKVTIGSMLDRVPGFLTNISLKWQKDYPWEIAIGNPETGNTIDSKMLVLPHVLDVSCQFTPVHNFVPRKSITDSPFFATAHGDNLGTTGTRAFYSKGASTLSQQKTSIIAGSTSNPLSSNIDNDGDGIPNFIDADSIIDDAIGDFVGPLNFNNIG